MQQAEKIIARFLIPALSALLVVYITTIRPFQLLIAAKKQLNLKRKLNTPTC